MLRSQYAPVDSGPSMSRMHPALIHLVTVPGLGRYEYYLLQAHAKKARAQMEAVKTSKREKQQKLASILDNMTSSRGTLEDSRSSLEVLKEQAQYHAPITAAMPKEPDLPFAFSPGAMHLLVWQGGMSCAGAS